MRKRRKSGKIMVLVMVAMLALSGMAYTKTAYAANTTDEKWSFALGVKITKMSYIPNRIKENDSKIYINWIAAYGGNLSKITVAPYGSHEKDGAHRTAGTSTGGDRRCIMNSTGKYALTNYVYELKYRYASVGMLGNKGGGAARGLWSPDCAGSYTVLK